MTRTTRTLLLPLLPYLTSVRGCGAITFKNGYSSKFGMVEILDPTAKMVINDESKQQVCDIGILAVLEPVLAQTCPGLPGHKMAQRRGLWACCTCLSSAGFHGLLKREDSGR